MKTQEVLAYIESGEDTAYGMFADLDPKIKKKIFQKIESSNCENILYPNLIHPNAIVDSTIVKMDHGNIISAGVVMACDIELGTFNLINRS